MSNRIRKIRRTARRNAIGHYRAFCDYINEQKFFKRVAFAIHVICGRL